MGIYVLIALISLIFGALIGFIFSKNFTAKLREDFKNIANQALIDNQNQLQQQNSLTLEDKLKPLGEAIEKYQKEIGEFEKEHAKDTAVLKTEIQNLAENSRVLQEGANRLTQALTQNQNIKGQFGEDTLEVILNTCGMVENVHYKKQFSTISEVDGEQRRIRPDFVLNLPGGQHIVIDSKVNLENFIKYQNEEDKTQKERLLKDFRTDIKTTIKNLSEKNYQHAQNINSPDFIFAYFPIEGSISLLYDDIEIVKFAHSKNVILIGTASLITTLQLVQTLVAREKQFESVHEIAKTGAALYERFVDFCQNLQNLRRKFKGVDEEFETTLNRFSRGEDSLFKKSEKLKELGINSTKQIPEEFLTEV